MKALTDAQRALVEAHADGWVIPSATRPFRHAWVDQSELESLARFGLVKAAVAFDPFRGKSFTSYAHLVIRGVIRDAKRTEMLAHGWSRDQKAGVMRQIAPHVALSDALRVADASADPEASLKRRDAARLLNDICAHSPSDRIRAMIRARLAGRRVLDIALQYGVPDRYVSTWIRRVKLAWRQASAV